MKTVDEYIKQFPKETQAILKKIRMIIKKSAPKVEEGLAYGMAGYKLNKKPLVYFAAWKEHVGFYATPSGHTKFKKELSKYQGAKGSVKFPLSAPIPYPLIEKIVKYRVKENSKAKK